VSRRLFRLLSVGLIRHLEERLGWLAWVAEGLRRLRERRCFVPRLLNNTNGPRSIPELFLLLKHALLHLHNSSIEILVRFFLSFIQL